MNTIKIINIYLCDINCHHWGLIYRSHASLVGAPKKAAKKGKAHGHSLKFDLHFLPCDFKCGKDMMSVMKIMRYIYLCDMVMIVGASIAGAMLQRRRGDPVDTRSKCPRVVFHVR